MTSETVSKEIALSATPQESGNHAQCCSPGEQETCCMPAAKATCCGDSSTSTCGCK